MNAFAIQEPVVCLALDLFVYNFRLNGFLTGPPKALCKNMPHWEDLCYPGSRGFVKIRGVQRSYLDKASGTRVDLYRRMNVIEMGCVVVNMTEGCVAKNV